MGLTCLETFEALKDFSEDPETNGFRSSLRVMINTKFSHTRNEEGNRWVEGFADARLNLPLT